MGSGIAPTNVVDMGFVKPHMAVKLVFAFLGSMVPIVQPGYVLQGRHGLIFLRKLILHMLIFLSVVIWVCVIELLVYVNAALATQERLVNKVCSVDILAFGDVYYCSCNVFDIVLCPVATGNAGLLEECAGHGRCMSLGNVNKYPDNYNYFGSRTYDGWDADRIYGCVCDRHWEGVDCSLRSCLKGDDPLTTGVNEIRYVDCTYTTASGGLQFLFRGRKSAVVPYDASATLIKYLLEQMSPAIEDVTVTTVAGTGMCSSGGSTTQIVFHTPQGNLSESTLSVLSVNGFAGSTAVFQSGQSSVLNSGYTSQSGTKEYVTCSNHGVCDTNRIVGTNYASGLGQCRCEPGFKSSDGKGGSGTRDDCGFNYTGAMLGLTTLQMLQLSVP